jgi:hypothetical protein
MGKWVWEPAMSNGEAFEATGSGHLTFRLWDDQRYVE